MWREIKLGDISVDVLLKDIKNIHLSVHPPTGRVRISAPSRMSMDSIRVFAISKLSWIKQQQQKIQQQERETPREYLDRESHYVWGKRYLLEVIESNEAPTIELQHNRMHVGAAGRDCRQKAGRYRGVVSEAA
jgi:predicted metal-dependent hydrolase